MIYAIGVESKRHAIYTSGPPLGDENFRLVEADADGWIQHTGKECPLPDGARYEVKNRDGEWGEGVVGKWVHGSYQREYDIIAYRPILDAEPSEPEAPEWDGEGLPPVGCECEYIGNDTSWGTVRVIGYDGDAVVFRPSGKQYYSAVPSRRDEFRPIRTPAQRAEDALSDLFNQHAEVTQGKARTLAVWASRAIRDGKIPGVKLED